MFIKVIGLNDGLPVIIHHDNIAAVDIETADNKAVLKFQNGKQLRVEESFDEVAAMLLTPTSPHPPVGYHLGLGPVSIDTTANLEFLAAKQSIDTQQQTDPFDKVFTFGKEHQLEGFPVFDRKEDPDYFVLSTHVKEELEALFKKVFTTEQQAILRETRSDVKLWKSGDSIKFASAQTPYFVALMVAKAITNNYPIESVVPEEYRQINALLLALTRWLLHKGLELKGDIMIVGTTNGHAELRRDMEFAATGMFGRINIMPF